MTSKHHAQEDVFTSDRFQRSVKRRRGAERRLKVFGGTAIAVATGLLLILFVSISAQGYTAFTQTQLSVPIDLRAEELRVAAPELDAALRNVNFRKLVREGLESRLGAAEDRRGRREMMALLTPSAGYFIQQQVRANPDWIGTVRDVWLPASDDIDIIKKGFAPRDVPEEQRLITDRQLAWVERMEAGGFMEGRFNSMFFFGNDSREPEIAGIFGAAVGSILMLMVTLVVSLPLGVAAAVYLEEFAPKNWWTEFIDVNIRNLAAVPSIVFGLLALAVFIRLFGIPRSTPLAGGLALSLLTLPTIIIAARAAIAAVPPSLREGALELGASKLQTVTQVVLPSAMPGILTGTIISMAEALGETAPLLMIGMVAFMVDTPAGILDPAAPLPVQIYTWSTSPERAFAEKTAAAIMVLLVLLVFMNSLAIYLRNRFQHKW